MSEASNSEVEQFKLHLAAEIQAFWKRTGLAIHDIDVYTQILVDSEGEVQGLQVAVGRLRLEA